MTMPANREKTALVLSKTAMKHLRDAKTQFRFEGLYATHELIVDYLLHHIDMGGLRNHLRGIAPTPRGRMAKAVSRKNLKWPRKR